MFNASWPGFHTKNLRQRGPNEEKSRSCNLPQRKALGMLSLPTETIVPKGLYLLKTAQILYFLKWNSGLTCHHISTENRVKEIKGAMSRRKWPIHPLSSYKENQEQQKFTPYFWVVRPESVLYISDKVRLEDLQIPLSNTFINPRVIFLVYSISQITKIVTGHKVWE